MNLIPVKSSNILMIGYDGSPMNVLIVIFHKEGVANSAYVYNGVAEEHFNPVALAIEREESVGAAFNKYIKQLYAGYIIPLSILRLDAGEAKTEEGSEITVTWGEEVFCPVPYQSFRFGPLTMTTRIRAGETPDEAFKRAWTHLDRLAHNSYQWKRDGFHKRLVESK